MLGDWRREVSGEKHATVPQLPQLLGSVCVLTQPPLQRVCPGGQPHWPLAQKLVAHCGRQLSASVAGDIRSNSSARREHTAVPHLPQFKGSVCILTHWLLHAVCGGAHTTEYQDTVKSVPGRRTLTAGGNHARHIACDRRCRRRNGNRLGQLRVARTLDGQTQTLPSCVRKVNSQRW